MHEATVDKLDGIEATTAAPVADGLLMIPEKSAGAAPTNLPTICVANSSKRTQGAASTRSGKERDAKYDGIHAFSNDIQAYKYPKGFKASGVDKYEANADPNLWLCRYSAAIEASGGDDKAKALYFAVAMEATPSPGSKHS